MRRSEGVASRIKASTPRAIAAAENGKPPDSAAGATVSIKETAGSPELTAAGAGPACSTAVGWGSWTMVSMCAGAAAPVPVLLGLVLLEVCDAWLPVPASSPEST